MWQDITKVAVAVSMWVAGLTLMVVATVSGWWVLIGWSVLLALGGSIFIGWHMLVVERARIEVIASLAAEVAVTTTLESVR